MPFCCQIIALLNFYNNLQVPHYLINLRTIETMSATPRLEPTNTDPNYMKPTVVSSIRAGLANTREKRVEDLMVKPQKRKIEILEEQREEDKNKHSDRRTFFHQSNI